MDDLISRRAAIDALCRVDESNTRSIIAIIKLPSAQPEEKCGECDAWNQYKNYPRHRWMPCSEELPKKSGLYYVSGGDKVWVCQFLIIPNFTGGWCNDASNPVVQAWMPLPEPWEVEKECLETK